MGVVLFAQHRGLALQLAEARGDLLAAERAKARLEQRLEHWIDQAIRARGERDKVERDFLAMAKERDDAQRCLTQAIDEKADALGRIHYLEQELADMERSREELVGMADGLREELRELRAGLTIGALHKVPR